MFFHLLGWVLFELIFCLLKAQKGLFNIDLWASRLCPAVDRLTLTIHFLIDKDPDSPFPLWHSIGRERAGLLWRPL